MELHACVGAATSAGLHGSGTMRQPHLTRLLALAAASALAVAGCTTDNPLPTVTATSFSPSETPQAESVSPSAEAPLLNDGPVEEGEQSTPGPANAAPFVADREPDTAEASVGAFLSPVNLRFGVHDGFDRIVLDLVGAGTPGWTGEYVENPTFQASGVPLDLLGEDYLRIQVRGVVYPTEDGAQPFAGASTVTPKTGGVVKEVRYGSVFEGQTEVFIGLSSDEPFRVFSLADPTRVVIDVQHP